MSNKASELIDGLLVVDKPAGMTSHDVVARCRRIVGQRRVGHAGTLDPGATGVLLVALGRATRLMKFVSELPKSYVGELVLGRTTSTLDDEGETTAEFDMSEVVLTDVQKAAEKLVGDILQTPPMVSALKVNGKRLHELARAGIEVEREARPVTVFRYGVTATSEPSVFAIDVQCSSGTYVRTLAADVGEMLGGGAHLRRLRRTAIGPFNVEQALSLDEIETAFPAPKLSSLQMVGHLDQIKVDADLATDIGHGKSLPAEIFGADDGPWAVTDTEGNLLAIYETRDGHYRPAVVISAK